MFIHRQAEAWDTLGSALIRAGFRMDASWPVHTESDVSTHQAKKNAASTTLLVRRKRGKASTEVWCDDLKGKLRREDIPDHVTEGRSCRKSISAKSWRCSATTGIRGLWVN